MDDTILDLPLVGEPDIDGRLSNFCNQIRTESAQVRGNYTGVHPDNLALYLYGTLDQGQPHVVNKIQGAVHAFCQLASKTPPTGTPMSMTIQDGGEVVLTLMGEMAQAKFNAQPHPTQLAIAGQPPAAPPQFVPQPEDQAILDTSTVLDWWKSIMDAKMVAGGYVKWFRRVVRASQIYGWQISLVDWDNARCQPIFRAIPALQWYQDPMDEDPDQWMYLALDWPVDAQYAKKKYPDLAAKIDEAAQRGIYFAGGNAGYSQVYQGMTLARPFVTLSTFWFRDHETKMTLQDGINAGILEIRPLGGPADDAQPDDGMGGSEPSGPTNPGDGNGQGSDSGLAGQNESFANASVANDVPAGRQEPPPGDGVFLVATGKQVTEADEEWPMKLVIRRCVQIVNEVVENVENPAWDIQAVINYNINIPDRSFGQGEPQRMKSPQQDKNSVNGAMVIHATQYGAPTVVTDKSSKDELAQAGVTTYSSMAGRILSVDIQATGQKASDLFTILNPPPLPPAVPLVDDKLDKVFEDVSGYSAVQQGETPTANASGALVDSLQSAGQAATAEKLNYLQTMVQRAYMLVDYYCLHRMKTEDYLRINRTFSASVVEGKILPLLQNMDRSYEITDPSAKESRKAGARADFASGLIDEETACEILEYDYATVKMRKQQNSNTPGAVPGATQQPGGSFNGTPNAAQRSQGAPAYG